MYLYSSLSNTHTHTLFLPLPLTCSHRWRTARGGGGGIRRGTPSPPPPTLRTTSGLSPGSRWPSPVWPSQHGCLAQTSLPRSEPQYSPPCNKHETRSESTQHVYSTVSLLCLSRIPKGEDGGGVEVTRKTRALHCLLYLKDREIHRHLLTCGSTTERCIYVLSEMLATKC